MSRRARTGSPVGSGGGGCRGRSGPVSVQVEGSRVAPSPWRGRGGWRRRGAASRHRAGAAGAGVDRVGGVLLRGGEGGANADLGAGAAAGIGEAEAGEAVEGPGVAGEVVGLAEDGLGPGEAEPGEVGDDRGLVLGAAAGGVDVLDAEEEACRLSRARVRRRSGPRRRGRGGGGRSARGRSGCAGSVAA